MDVKFHQLEPIIANNVWNGKARTTHAFVIGGRKDPFNSGHVRDAQSINLV